MQSRTLGGEGSGSVSSSFFGQLVRKCPVLSVVMGGVAVPCLIDTGSMVTTVTESFFLVSILVIYRGKIASG